MNKRKLLDNLLKEPGAPIINGSIIRYAGDGYYLVSLSGSRTLRVLGAEGWTPGAQVQISTAENRIVGVGRRLGTPVSITL